MPFTQTYLRIIVAADEKPLVRATSKMSSLSDAGTGQSLGDYKTLVLRDLDDMMDFIVGTNLF